MIYRKGPASFVEVEFSQACSPQCYVSLNILTRSRFQLIPCLSAEEAWSFASYYPATADQVRMNVPGLCMAVGPLSPDTLLLASGSISYLDESMAYIAESCLPSFRVDRLMGQRYYNGLGWKNEILRRAECVRRARARGEDPIYTPLRDGTHDLKFCENCKKPQMQMQKCSGCLWARYCSKKCQKQHWPCHKPVCGPDTSFQQLGFFGMSCPWEEQVMTTRQNIIECTLECTDGSYAKDWSG